MLGSVVVCEGRIATRHVADGYQSMSDLPGRRSMFCEAVYIDLGGKDVIDAGASE
jgi:hypothetical protein